MDGMEIVVHSLTSVMRNGRSSFVAVAGAAISLGFVLATLVAADTIYEAIHREVVLTSANAILIVAFIVSLLVAPLIGESSAES